MYWVHVFLVHIMIDYHWLRHKHGYTKIDRRDKKKDSRFTYNNILYSDYTTSNMQPIIAVL